MRLGEGSTSPLLQCVLVRKKYTEGRKRVRNCGKIGTYWSLEDQEGIVEGKGGGWRMKLRHRG